MADAKVIPFDDDRSRGGAAQRPSRRRSAGSRRRNGEPAPVREIGEAGEVTEVREVQALPTRAVPQDDVPVTGEEQPPRPDGDGGGL